MLNSDLNYREQSKELAQKPKARNGITHTANLGIIPDIHARTGLPDVFNQKQPKTVPKGAKMTDK